MSNKENLNNINEASGEVLGGLIESTKRYGAFSRGWGIVSEDGANPLDGSNATLITPDEVVVVRQPRRGGDLDILEYTLSNIPTKLGAEVRQLLKEKGYI